MEKVMPGGSDAGAPASASSQAEPAAVIAECLARLAANAPAEEMLARLRAIEGQLGDQRRLRAQWLRAKAIATNRLGFGGEALGDLSEAKSLLDEAEHGAKAEVLQTIALVHSWRGEGREAALALLAAIAQSAVVNDRAGIALALIEAGRLQMEIGRPRDSHPLLACALQIGADELPLRERQRAKLNLVQALVASKQKSEARAQLDALSTVLTGASRRLQVLADIERARLALMSGDLAAARATLDATVQLVNPDSFERVEVAHAMAELRLAEDNPTQAADLLDRVISRYATDELTGREVSARLLQAQALAALDRGEEADRMLAAALRRAVARNLNGYADTIRSRIAARGGSERAWFPDAAPASNPMPDPARRFVRRRALGSGAFGRVDRAYDMELGIEVALKRTNLEDIYDTSLRARLIEAARTEVVVTSRIEHPGIARIYGLLVEGDRDALLIEEFIEGPTLRSALAQAMDCARALDLLARIAFALAAAHAAGVVHCDIKPDNVMLRTATSPVLVDFGIASILGKGKAGGRGGTPPYISPEQAAGCRIDARADLYSFGVMAHELLVGRPCDPAPAYGPLSIARRGHAHRVRRQLREAGLEPEVADLLARLLAPHPFWRPRSAGTIAAWLAQAAARAASHPPAGARTMEHPNDS
jgi:hypothetical protein